MNGTALPTLHVGPRHSAAAYPERPRDLTRALRLAWFTVGWNVLEGAMAVGAAVTAGSIALLGFGLDSFVETASGAVIVWRTVAERRTSNLEAVERIERLAGKLVAASLVALAAFIAADAGRALYLRERPEASMLGLVIAAVSIVAMQWLAREKRKVGRRLHSRSIQADAFQTTACLYLSLIVLVGVGLNLAFGWWWADPVAALVMVVPLCTEARDAWRGDPCCDDC
jgi:divalent metal cation (Fe/Co/Zn/Cd) transporter